MPSLQARLVRRFSRRYIRREGLTEAQLVRHLQKAFNSPPPFNVKPSGSRITKINCQGFQGERITASQSHAYGPVVLYIHGGAYIAGVTESYHRIGHYLAKQLDGSVYLTRYPFAPDNPYPEAVNHVLQAYQFLLDSGYSHDRIVLAGDSAGGGLSLALLLSIRDKGLPMPAGAALFSPGGNSAPTAYVQENDKTDVMLSADMINTVLDVYLPDHARRAEDYANPAQADFSGLPPLLITVAREECLYGDALDMRARADEAGVPMTWIEREGLFHVWPIMVPFLPEAKQDLKKVIHFMETCIEQRCSN